MHDLDFTTIKITNDVKIVTPTSPTFLTTFVLLEQSDWFEDEIKFVRTYIEPGMNVIDIGANYGVYCLSIAKILGDKGTVWAFEPTSLTSAYLTQGINENKLKNIHLIRAGLSDRIGKAKLYTSPNSELNSLSKPQVLSDQYEMISLLTLDHCMQKYKWDRIDFIKLDAEGEECNIIKKGKRTLNTLSPLIMFELKHVDIINLHLIDRLKDLGYDTYRLVPGLNVLIPFDHTKPYDDYLLNLFCCKVDRAQKLEEQGMLVRNVHTENTAADTIAISYITKLPYWQYLKNQIRTDIGNDSTAYSAILNKYILSLSDSLSSPERTAFLMQALHEARDMLSHGEQRIECLSTFSRIAFDAGERALGVQILSKLIDRYQSSIDYELHELFLPAAKRYDTITPDKGIKEWLYSSILEQCILKYAHSAYFSRHTTLPLFMQMERLGYMDSNMTRRYELIKSCFIQQA